MGDNEILDVSVRTRDNCCSSCGCPLDWSKRYRGEDGFYYIKCPACRNVTATEEPAFSREAMQYYHEGKLYFRKQNFEDAITSFDEAIKLCNTYYEAYWLRLLAENGIEYVEDITGRPKPTCHRCSEKSLLEQNDFLNAIKLAPKEIAASYSQSAAEIDAIRKHVLALARKGEEFDVFISFKKSDIDAEGNEILEYDTDGNPVGNRRTADCVLAERIYSHLKEKGLRVFYSEVSLLEAAGANFEATIFRALDTSKVFILIGTKSEYVNATWVKNEWKRYLRMMANGDKSAESFVYVYENKIPAKLDRNVLAGNRQALRYDAMFFAALDKVIERERARNLAPLERRTITGKMEALQEVAASLQYQSREFATDANFYVEVDDERKIDTVKKNLTARNFSGAEFMLKGLLKKMPENPRLHLLSAFAENGMADENEYVDAALANGAYIDSLDGIIAYCGKDDPTLATILGMVTKIFLRAGVKNPDVLRRSFKIICQCSNITYVQKGLRQYIKYMYQTACALPRIDDAKSVFEDLLQSIGLDDSLNDTNKSVVYAAYNADFAMHWHQLGNFDLAKQYYSAAIEYNPNVASYYFDLWLCKVGMRDDKDDWDAAQGIIIPDFELSDVESVLVHSSDENDDIDKRLNKLLGGFALSNKTNSRNYYAEAFVNIATEQVKQKNVAPAVKLFEYIVSTVSRNNVKLNESLLMPFSSALLYEGFFSEAGKYLREMLAISHNQCSKAFFNLILVDLECRTVDELIRCDKVVQLQDLPDFMSALGCGTAEEAEEYLEISEKKLEFYEKSRVQKGYSLLSESKFDEARRVFNDLLDFEKNTRKRNGTLYPDVYWGLLLAETECSVKEQLYVVAKQIAFPNVWIFDNANFKNYLNSSASNNVKAKEKEKLIKERDAIAASHCEQLSDRGFALLLQMKFAEAKKCFKSVLEFENNTLKRSVTKYPDVYWGLLLIDTESSSNKQLSIAKKRSAFPESKLKVMPNYIAYCEAAKANGVPIKQINDLMVKRQVECNREKGRRKVSRRRGVFALMILLTIAVVGGGIYGGFIFYDAGVSDNWYHTLQDNLSLVLGICIGGAAAIGGIIGLIAGASGEIGAAGAFGGAICGAIVVGLVFASCWALVPIGILLVLTGCIIGIVSYYNSNIELSEEEQKYLYDVNKTVKDKNGNLDFIATSKISRRGTSAFYKTVMCIILLVALALGVVGIVFIDELYSYVHFGIIIAVLVLYTIVIIVMFIKLRAGVVCKLFFVLLFLASLAAMIGLLVMPKFLALDIDDKDDFVQVQNCPYASFELQKHVDFDGEELPDVDKFWGNFDGQGFAITGFVQAGSWIDENKGSIHDIEFCDAVIEQGLINENKGEVTRIKLSAITAKFSGNNINNLGVLINNNRQEGNVSQIVGAELIVSITDGSYPYYVGTLIGQTEANISKLSVVNSLISHNDSTYYALGGIVGSALSGTTISESFTEKVSFVLGKYDGEDGYSSYAPYTGGIVGHFTGSMNDCYAYGNVFLGFADGFVGGLVGYMAANNANISHCYSSIDYSRSSVVVMEGEYSMVGVCGLIQSNITVTMNRVWHNSEAASYQYSNTNIVSSIYSSDDVGLYDNTFADRLQLDTNIWELSAGLRPELIWYGEWQNETAK